MNVKRMLNEEIRDKKRIGKNIFARASTRRGGISQALRTPYLFMNNSERKKLNGKVEVFNMNEIINYYDLKNKSKEEQKMLMMHWRENYQINNIIEGLGVSHNTYYKLLDKLDIPRNGVGRTSNIEKTNLSEDELNEVLSQPNNYMDFDKFKTLYRDQQMIIFNKYMENQHSIASLVDSWEGSNVDYFYNLKYQYKKSSKKRANKLSLSQKPSTENSLVETVNKDVISVTNEESNEKVNHSSSISANGKTFNFELNGEYSADAIIRRLNILIEEIKDSEEKLQIDIKISN